MDASTETAPERARHRRGCFPVILGGMTVLVGIPMLVCPGPGMAVIAAGVGMIAAGLGLRTSGRP